MPSQTGTVYIKNKPLKAKDTSTESSYSDLDWLVKKSQQIIFEAKAVFPFEFFPDRITICANRVTITRRGLMSKDEFPMQIENLTGARIYTSLMFASLHIETFGYRETPEPIKYLKLKDAKIARRYILALIECKKSNLDLSHYTVDELRYKLRKIGMVREGGRIPNEF